MHHSQGSLTLILYSPITQYYYILLITWGSVSLSRVQSHTLYISQIKGDLERLIGISHHSERFFTESKFRKLKWGQTISYLAGGYIHSEGEGGRKGGREDRSLKTILCFKFHCLRYSDLLISFSSEDHLLCSLLGTPALVPRYQIHFICLILQFYFYFNHSELYKCIRQIETFSII